MKKKIIIGLVAVLVIIQFFRIDTNVPEYSQEDDFFQHHVATKEVQVLIESTCYDCHSYKTKYPFYSEIAPISWFLADHIEEAREHLNFSEWGNYTDKRAAHKLEECYEEVEEGEMPLWSYKLTHFDAQLSDQERNTLVIWFKSQYDYMKSTKQSANN
tara:strand:+ start:163 stop:636 length:474 start_codon:yes stop_codon:yes gene_type:complete